MKRQRTADVSVKATTATTTSSNGKESKRQRGPHHVDHGDSSSAEQSNIIIQNLSNACTDGPSAFPGLAEFLMNQCVIHVLDSARGVSALLRITELEFYLQDLPGTERAHVDPFPHCMPVQLHAGRWYFHMLSSVKPYSFKGGSYKGTDLTFGNANSYAGILFRSAIVASGDGAVRTVEGPSLLTDCILELTGCSSVRQLVEIKLQDDLRAVAPADGKLPSRAVHLLLRSREEMEALGGGSHARQLRALFVDSSNDTVYSCPRFGLSLKKHTILLEEKLRYIMKHYRFCVRPQNMKKGRHNLLVALYGTLRWHEGLDDMEEIAQRMEQVLPFNRKGFFEAAARGERKRQEIIAAEGFDNFPMGPKSLAYLKRFFIPSFSLANFTELYCYLEGLPPATHK